VVNKVHGTHSAAIEMVAKDAKLVPLKSEGVYIGGVMYGSPALKGLFATLWILEINEIPVHNVHDLIKIIEEKKFAQGEYVRVKQIGRKGITSVEYCRVDDR